MSFHFILIRGTAAPSKEGRGRRHHPKEAEEGSTTKKEEGIAAIGRRHHCPEGGREGEVHLSFLVVLPSFSSLCVWG